MYELGNGNIERIMYQLCLPLKNVDREERRMMDVQPE